MSRRTFLTAGLVAAVSSGGALYAVSTDPSLSAAEAAPTVAPADTETVVRGDLVEETKVVGNIGYGTPTKLPIAATGLVTEVSAPGTAVEPGSVLVAVNGLPVYVALGSTPLYRDLRRVPANERDEAGDRVGALEGDDVKQLQSFLLDAGFDDRGHLTDDGVFGRSTERAVKAWQKSVGHPATGKVNRSQLVFVNDAVRVSAAPAVGEEFSAIEVTPDAPLVTAEVDAAEAAFFDAGSVLGLSTLEVSATGTVTKTTPKIDDEGKRTLAVEIQPDAEFGSAMAIEVTARRSVATDVLYVPVRTLVALADGGWAVQVSGRELTPVKVVTVVNGQAQVDGVDEGTSVEVPA